MIDTNCEGLAESNYREFGDILTECDLLHSTFRVTEVCRTLCITEAQYYGSRKGYGSPTNLQKAAQLRELHLENDRLKKALAPR